MSSLKVVAIATRGKGYDLIPAYVYEAIVGYTFKGIGAVLWAPYHIAIKDLLPYVRGKNPEAAEWLERNLTNPWFSGGRLAVFVEIVN